MWSLIGHVSLGQNVRGDSWYGGTRSPLTTSLVVAVLPMELKRDWHQETAGTTKVPSIDLLLKFLRIKSQSLSEDQLAAAYAKQEAKKEPKQHIKKEPYQKRKAAVHSSMAPPPPPSQPKQAQTSRPANSQSWTYNSYQGYRYKCLLCTEYHPLFLCSNFNSMSLA